MTRSVNGTPVVVPIMLALMARSRDYSRQERPLRRTWGWVMRTEYRITEAVYLELTAMIFDQWEAR